MSLSQSQINELNNILKSSKENTDLFNAMDSSISQSDKYKKKLKNAMESYAKDINPSEVLVLHDDTAFGSAKDGFIITHDCIHYKEMMEDPGSIKLTKKMNISNDKKDTFYVDSTKIKMSLLGESAGVISHLLLKLVEFNSELTGNELISHKLNFARVRLLTIGTEDSGEVVDELTKTANDFKSHHDMNKIIFDLINVTESIEDYGLPEAKKTMEIIYQQINVKDIKSIDGLIRVADSLTQYMKDNNRSQTFYAAAETKITTVEEAISLAESLNDTYHDKEWAKKVYKKSQELAITYKEYCDVGESIGGYLEDYIWAKENLITAYENRLQNQQEQDKSILIQIAISLIDYGNHKDNAQTVIREYLDKFATDFGDYKEAFAVVAGEDYLNNMSLAQEVFSKAKALCKTYSDYYKLLDEINWTCEFCSQNLLSFAKEVITKFENNKQKEEFVEYYEDELDKVLLDDIKSSSIEELKQKYEAKDENRFDDELELNLPAFDEIMDSDSGEPEESLDACFDWIRKMDKEVLTLDSPITEFENGDYETSLKSVEGMMSESSIHPKTNAMYLASFKQHIELKKSAESDQKSSTMSPEKHATIEVVPDNNQKSTPEESELMNQPSDLKTQYANKIASGEIDPVDTSFADFEAASKDKEIDYKAIYSQMISEGRIDPTETTFDEMIKVSKLLGGVAEADYKATYSKYIGTGEIDPSETTYDEIVTIASIFNDINADSSVGVEIDKDTLVKELQKYVDIIEDEDYKESAQDSLNDGDLWFITDNTDEEPIKRKVFDYYESIAETSDDYRDIAERFQDELKDTKNSIRVFKIAEQKIGNFRNALSIANDVADDYANSDKDWARNVYQKAYKFAVECDDESELKDLAVHVSVDYNLGDKTWARELFKEALEYQSDFKELISIADSIMDEDYLDDKDWATELLKEYESKADTYDEICPLLSSVISEAFLDNQTWGLSIVEKLRPLCKTVDNYVQVIGELDSQKELAKGLLQEAIPLLENDDEKESLADAAEYNLDDEALANEIKNSSIDELKTKYGKPSTEELKKLYAAGIGDGSIDPVEVSFDSFMGDYGSKKMDQIEVDLDNFEDKSEKKMTPEKEAAIKQVEDYGGDLKNLPSFQDDKDVVITAVKSVGPALEYASQKLKSDKDVIWALTECEDQAGDGVEYVTEKFKDDREFILAVMQNEEGFGCEALDYASERLKSDKELLKIYIDYQIDNYNDSFQDALEDGVFEGFDMSLVNSIASGSLSINSEDYDVLLLEAAMDCNYEQLTNSINNGANINIKGSNGFTPLMYVANRGCKKLAEYLVVNGADIKVTNHRGETAKDVAEDNGNEEIAQYLWDL